jgi:hypothetical protein
LPTFEREFKKFCAEFGHVKKKYYFYSKICIMNEIIFKRTINYLKIITAFGAVMCFLLMFFTGFDPWHSLDKMIWTDLYGNPELPQAAKPAFVLPFLLFCWLSVLTMIVLFLITQYALSKKEKWAFYAFVLLGLFWPLGGALITYYTKAWSYFVSVGMMTGLFLPPVIVLYPFFRHAKL